MKNLLEKSLVLLVALVVNMGLYLMVPYIQVLAARAAVKQPKGPKLVDRPLVFEEPTREKMEKKEIKPIKVTEYHPPSMQPRPAIPGAGLKIDLSAAGGEGLGLLSGNSLRGEIGSGSGTTGAGMGAMTYEPGQTDTDAKMLGDAPLTIPPRAERDGISGTVELTFVVNESGSVEQIQVLKEDPKGYGFAGAAIDAAKKLRFKPATLQKTPVRQRFKRTFAFDLQ